GVALGQLGLGGRRHPRISVLHACRPPCIIHPARFFHRPPPPKSVEGGSPCRVAETSPAAGSCGTRSPPWPRPGCRAGTPNCSSPPRRRRPLGPPSSRVRTRSSTSG